MWQVPDQANIQIALSGNIAGPFIPQNTLRFNNVTGSVRLDNAADFAVAIRPSNGINGACTVWVNADPLESSGGCGCDPACDLPISGSVSSVSNEQVTIGTLLFPGDGTYTLNWTVTGREIASGLAISTVTISVYHVIGNVATKVSETPLTDVDEPTGFGTPVSNPLAGGVTFDVTGKLNAPAAWVLGGCAQANQGVIPI
jgi:hypothetical protein